MPKAIRVTPVAGEPFTFLVTSESSEDTDYKVMLLEERGFGRCTCNHWACKVGPLIKDAYVDLDAWRACTCKHVRIARDNLLHSVVLDLANPKHFNERI